MPKRHLGQHFLSDPRLLRRIAQFAEIPPGVPVLEIGPGRGALTRELARTAALVVAIETDRDLIPVLRASMPENVRVIEGDALEIDFRHVIEAPFVIVGNLPYNITTPLLKKFIACRSATTSVTVMIQKEVADRILSGPGSKQYGPLSILVQYYATPTWGFDVPPGAFSPRPAVMSTVLRLNWKTDVADAVDFTDFVHRAFHARRKKLLNNIPDLTPATLQEAGVPVNARPEELSIEDFLKVHQRLKAIIDDR